MKKRKKVVQAKRKIFSDFTHAKSGDVIEDLQGVQYFVLALLPNQGRGQHLWLQGKCAVCGESFTVKTARVFDYLVRTCELHRGTMGGR